MYASKTLLPRVWIHPWWVLASLLISCSTLPSSATTATLTTPAFRMTIDSENGGFEIFDIRGGTRWQSNPFAARFGELTYRKSGERQTVSLSRCAIEQTSTSLLLRFIPARNVSTDWLAVTVSSGPEEGVLEISYKASDTLEIENVRLFENAFWTTDSQKGYLAIPVREGLLVPADSGLSFTHRFDTSAYEGCHMQMLGLGKEGAAALITWNSPYVAIDVRSVLTNAVWIPGKQILSTSVLLRNKAQSFQVRFLGKGTYSDIAAAYRKVASDKSLVVTWDQKLRSNPDRSKLLGAINFKLWSTLDRQMNESSTHEEKVQVNWTFQEAAQVAEHLRQELKLEKVLFTIGGWIHRGYDNQHPDILPAAPECGGDEALRACAQRVMQLGYLFCLHDNYQDIYRDSPSWSEDLIMKSTTGEVVRGGHWAGGRAFLTCSKQAYALAQRPQNLLAVRSLTAANSYFIDTTYASGLQECFDPKHPIDRSGDLRWKAALSDYARDIFGVFGSECGREWAIPHSDFFEGITGVSGNSYHDTGLIKKVGGVVVPLFEMVYRDCIAAYGKYGYDISKSAEYVLHHISIGRPLNHHDVPPHLYWHDPFPSESRHPDSDLSVFTWGIDGWSAGMHPFDRFVKNTAEILSPLYEMTARTRLTQYEFLSPDHQVRRSVFNSEGEPTEVIVNSRSVPFQFRSGEEVVELPAYGFFINSPHYVAFLATSWKKNRFASPTLLTLRSLGEKPLDQSPKIRVFHGFGDPSFSFRGRKLNIDREAVLDL